MTHFQHWNLSRKVPCVLVAALASFLLLPMEGQGFDGNRKGLVAGFGVGIAPYSHFRISQLRADVTELGYTGEFVLGYGWNDRNVIAYNSTGCLYTTDDLAHVTIFQRFVGIRWYHYCSGANRPYFVSLGVGVFFLGVKYDNVRGNGFGWNVGIGKELLKHAQAGFYVMGGRTSNKYSVRANNVNAMFQVTLLAY